MQIDQCIKTLRGDNGGEDTSLAMVKFCKASDIEKTFIPPPYTPQLNGVTERIDHMLVKCARCMLEHAELPNSY